MRERRSAPTADGTLGPTLICLALLAVSSAALAAEVPLADASRPSFSLAAEELARALSESVDRLGKAGGANAGPSGWLGWSAFFALVTLASFVSEDLTCIGVGLLVGRGWVGFPAGTAACVVGLWIGDLLLFAAGRSFGSLLSRRGPPRPRTSAAAVARRVSSWLSRRAGAEALERGSRWLRGSAVAALLLARFMPGMRLPIYVAAGMARYPAGRFALLLLAAASVWTPAVVGAAAGAGALVELRAAPPATALASLAALAVTLLVATRLLPALSTFRGRRLLVSRWRRLRHWEFWPIPVFYLPVLIRIAGLAWRHRSLAVVTAANPGLPAGGGLLGERKDAILGSYVGPPEFLPRSRLLHASDSPQERARRLEAFMAAEGLQWPVVLKPSVGERGRDVAIVEDDAAARAYLDAHPGDTLAQEYVPGVELGVFYVRLPSEERGRVFSITEKRMTAVTGDGHSTLEELILRDDRAICQAQLHLAAHAALLDHVLAAGEVFPLVRLGVHSRGSLFVDGSHLNTAALAETMEEISRGFPGFFFGRFDVRAPSLDALRAGRDIKVLELNGLTAESTNLYDPRHSIVDAYRILFHQWEIAFAIGAENRARGARPISLGDAWRLWRGWRLEISRTGRAAPRSAGRRPPQSRGSPARTVTSLSKLSSAGSSQGS